MKRNFTYLILLILFFGATAFVVIRYKDKLKNKIVAFYPLQERKGPLAKSAEWISIKSSASNLITSIREKPDDSKTALALATIYIQEARITGNYSYYNKAAAKYIDDVLAKDQNHFEALTLKALLLVSQHHFAEGLVVAKKARDISPYYAFLHGILIDAYVEMGNYKDAVISAENMISLRPDIRSYSRISYLREIHGDYAGAIEAMKMAVEAGGYGDEPTSWTRIQLARLYENTGDIKNAEMHYTIALDQRPGYPYAIAGLGSIRMAAGHYPKAISLYEQADSLISDYSFKEQLAALYELTGQSEKAENTINAVIDEMKKEVEKGEEEASPGHHADGELANTYLLAHKPGKALEHALKEYNRRPENIEVNETVAWAYYKKGNADKALPYLEAALRTSSKNPTLLCRAGLIYAKKGDNAKAKINLEDGLKNNPNIDPSLKKESADLLQQL